MLVYILIAIINETTNTKQKKDEARRRKKTTNITLLRISKYYMPSQNAKCKNMKEKTV